MMAFTSLPNLLKTVYVNASHLYPFNHTLSSLTAWTVLPYVLHLPKAWFLAVFFLSTFFLANLMVQLSSDARGLFTHTHYQATLDSWYLKLNMAQPQLKILSFI